MMAYFTGPQSVTACLFITKIPECFIFLKILILTVIAGLQNRKSGFFFRLLTLIKILTFMERNGDNSFKIIFYDKREKVVNLFRVLVKKTTFCFKKAIFSFLYFWILVWSSLTQMMWKTSIKLIYHTHLGKLPFLTKLWNGLNSSIKEHLPEKGTKWGLMLMVKGVCT